MLRYQELLTDSIVVFTKVDLLATGKWRERAPEGIAPGFPPSDYLAGHLAHLLSEEAAHVHTEFPGSSELPVIFHRRFHALHNHLDDEATASGTHTAHGARHIVWDSHSTTPVVDGRLWERQPEGAVIGSCSSLARAQAHVTAHLRCLCDGCCDTVTPPYVLRAAASAGGAGGGGAGAGAGGPGAGGDARGGSGGGEREALFSFLDASGTAVSITKAFTSDEALEQESRWLSHPHLGVFSAFFGIKSLGNRLNGIWLRSLNRAGGWIDNYVTWITTTQTVRSCPPSMLGARTLREAIATCSAQLAFILRRVHSAHWVSRNLY